jgi:hypothetical protein
VWAEIEDSNGYRKRRPAVVITPTSDIGPDQPLRLLAITTRLPTPLPDGHVMLPWDPQGKARSGLRRACAVVTSWRAIVQFADVAQVAGILPTAKIEEILAKIESSGLDKEST